MQLDQLCNLLGCILGHVNDVGGQLHIGHDHVIAVLTLSVAVHQRHAARELEDEVALALVRQQVLCIGADPCQLVGAEQQLLAQVGRGGRGWGKLQAACTRGSASAAMQACVCKVGSMQVPPETS